MTCLTSAFLRVVVTQQHPVPVDWIVRRNVLFRTQSSWKWLLLSPCMPLIAIQRDNHHETMPESNVHLPMSHTNPNAGPSIEDASRHNGTASNILKSGKLRSLFQWSSRVTRAPPPRSPGPPAPGKGSPGKGKPEDGSHAAGGTSSNSRRDSSSSSSSSNSSYSRGSHSSGRSHHSDDHDHGVDWDW